MSTPDEGSNTTSTEIARIAARLFAERGFDATPVRVIAEHAGVTCPTLYYHFGNKEGLGEWIVARPLERVAERLSRLIGEPLEPVERLIRAVDAYFEFSREDPDRARFVYAVLFGPLAKSLATQVNTRIRRVNELLLRVLGTLVEAGIVEPGRVDDMTLALRGHIVIRTMDFLYRGSELGPEVAHRVVDDVLRGFRLGGEGVDSNLNPHRAPRSREVSR